jgi:hypothetical protein
MSRPLSRDSEPSPPDTRRRRELLVALACGFIALAVSGAALLVSLHRHDWKTSALVRMQPDEPMAQIARRVDPGFVFVPHGHYDGVYAYAIALDPLAQGDAHTKVDFPSYRYGRVGLGWLAWLLSLGRPRSVPTALMIITLLAMPVAGIFTSLISSSWGWSPWGGLVASFNPGFVIGVTSDTSEPLQAALLGIGLYLWFRRRLVPSVLVLAYLCLVKEQFIAVPAGLLLWELIEWRRGRKAPDLWKRLGMLAATPLPLVAWWAYVSNVFGRWQPDQPQFLAAPFTGWLDTLRKANQLIEGTSYQSQVGYVTVALLITVGTILVIGSLVALRMRTPFHPIFLFLVLVLSVLSYWQLLFPKEVLRLMAVQLALLPAVLAGARRAVVTSRDLAAE